MKLEEAISSLEIRNHVRLRDYEESWNDTGDVRLAIECNQTTDIPLHQGFHSTDYSQRIASFHDEGKYGLAVIETLSWDGGMCGQEEITEEKLILLGSYSKACEVQRVGYEGRTRGLIKNPKLEETTNGVKVTYNLGGHELQREYRPTIYER